MATAAVTYTFSPSTLIQSSQVNTDFSDLVSFLNNQVIHKDGSIAATAHLSGPSGDPSTSTQYANKAYVDRLGIVAQQKLTTTTAAYPATTVTDMALNNVNVTAGRTYQVHLHVQYLFAAVNTTATWTLELLINGVATDRFTVIRTGIAGTSQYTFDGSLYWTPSVTASSDDLTVRASLSSAGATLQLSAAADATRSLTLLDVGVL